MHFVIRAFCTTNFQGAGIKTVENMSKIWLLVVVRSLQTTHSVSES